MSKRTKKAVTGVERADEMTHAQRMVLPRTDEEPERPERTPALAPDTTERLFKLIEMHYPSDFGSNERLSITYGFSTHIYWRCAPEDPRASVWLGWGKERKVLVGVQYIEGPPANLLKVGNLLVRITALAESLQEILDEVPPNA